MNHFKLAFLNNIYGIALFDDFHLPFSVKSIIYKYKNEWSGSFHECKYE